MPVTPPTAADVRIYDTAADFREWLAENHDRAGSLWVGYYKKHVAKRAMTYVEAVEEALCYGWIDGITYRIDDEVTASRFTPRRKGSNWSARNLERVARLIDEGRMRPPGMRAYEQRDRGTESGYSYETSPRGLSAELEAKLRANAAAWRYWQERPPSYRRSAAWWVMSARREETREKRLRTLIEDSAAGHPIRPLSYGDARR